MKKYTRQALTFLLTAAMLLPAVSCGNSSVQETDTSAAQTEADAAETVETETEVTCDLPDTDWGGRTFTVLGFSDGVYAERENFEIIAEEMTGEVVNDAIFTRNSNIEEKYNAVIAQSLVSDIVNKLNSSVMAGDNLYDLAFNNTHDICNMTNKGLLLDMYAINHMDFTKPYWNQHVNETVSVLNKLYFTSSDFAPRDKSRAYIIFYNRDLVNANGLENPVSLVDEGTWTMDAMRKMSETVAHDVNGDGVMGEGDVCGLAMDSYNAFASFVIASQNITWAKNSSDEIVVALNTEHLVNTVDKALALSCNTEMAFFCNDMQGKVSYDYWESAPVMFKEGDVLFLTDFPFILAELSEGCEFEYGILPFPKYDESQTVYQTMGDVWAMLFGIPACAADPDFSGFMLEALSYESTDTSLNAYLEVSCKRKHIYDEDSARMLDLTFDNVVYDPAMIYNFGGMFNIINDALPKAKENTFASLYAAKAEAEEKFIANLMKTIAEQ